MVKHMRVLVVWGILLLTAVEGNTPEFRKLTNNSFKIGEKLTFAIKYGFITAGVAEMAIPSAKRIAGRDAFHITFRVNSVSTFDPFFKVRDRYETYVDQAGIFPWRFEQHIREGNYSRDFSAFFDHRKGKAKTPQGDYEIPQYVHDIISAFYFARIYDYKSLKKGESFRLENFYKDKVFPLEVVYHGKETIEVEAGKFECIIVEPLVVEGGLFKNEGSIYIWLSDDELKVPIKVKTKVIIGSIDAELIEYEGLAGVPSSKK
ncbi:MAG: DUF3108 domain-containing protein [Ignavibacteriales bacterium]|nr:DUF3108 domain-containing protein [Ignavibacteriales bacterium]MCF8305811.1 DUF3108 domain-containing protein [Ignavibacteriales bacterium]MCF8315533.1 DUF3108 domain-containing protein [Ignavibacteriales bacterium]MCF8436937.1 DUF3108 domain-containing protein [Ignavibacteriales bacterium]